MRAGWRCLLVIVGCWGCAGDLENPERFGFLLDDDGPPPAPQCMTELLEARCGKPGCHVEGTQQIDLVSDGLEERLIGKKSTSTQCKDFVLVTTDGTDSLLLQKVKGVPPCGLPMPLGEKLSDNEVSCLAEWVEDVSGSKGGGS